MQRIIAAGILYLLGVALILILKPSLMFTEDGSWKEFGIGRNRNTHTWLPFWFFAILWALISYIITILIFVPQLQETQTATTATAATAVTPKIVAATIEKIKSSSIKSKRTKGIPMNLPDGYYIKNSAATDEAGGIPKYIYIGKGLPEE